MSTRRLDSEESRTALNYAMEAERAAEDVARAHGELHRALDRYAMAGASLSSLVPELSPHLLRVRAQTIRRTLNRADVGDLSGRAREVREGVERMEG